jgi:hypothetical protein
MQKSVTSSLLLLAVFLFVGLQPVIARSGCCSHHGGVSSDGCGCNDGTPLSDTCAPYYVCTANTNSQAPAVQSTEIPPTVPTKVAPPTSTPSPTTLPTPSPAVKGVSTKAPQAPVNVAGDSSGGNPIPGLFGLGVVGGLGYLAWRKIKNRGQKNPLPHNETTEK